MSRQAIHLVMGLNRVAPVLNSSDPEDLLALVASLTKKFHLTYMPGVRKTIKAITAYIESGTAPKYPLSPGLAQKIKEEKAKARSDRAESQAAKSQNKGI